MVRIRLFYSFLRFRTRKIKPVKSASELEKDFSAGMRIWPWWWMDESLWSFSVCCWKLQSGTGTVATFLGRMVEQALILPARNPIFLLANNSESKTSPKKVNGFEFYQLRIDFTKLFNANTCEETLPSPSLKSVRPWSASKSPEYYKSSLSRTSSFQISARSTKWRQNRETIILNFDFTEFSCVKSWSFASGNRMAADERLNTFFWNSDRPRTLFLCCKWYSCIICVFYRP